MLTLLSNQPAKGYCDGLSRRSFLRIGGLGLGGLTFPELLRAESEQGRGKSQKAIILVYLPGGPPHQDMYDIKTDAPSEIRGPFSPIGTNVAGIQLCEHLPRMAKMADKLTFIRSVVGAKDRHESFQCVTGRLSNNAPPGGMAGDWQRGVEAHRRCRRRAQLCESLSTDEAYALQSRASELSWRGTFTLHAHGAGEG